MPFMDGMGMIKAGMTIPNIRRSSTLAQNILECS